MEFKVGDIIGKKELERNIKLGKLAVVEVESDLSKKNPDCTLIIDIDYDVEILKIYNNTLIDIEYDHSILESKYLKTIVVKRVINNNNRSS
ncbi:hypothetical protein [Clostridium sp.]|uniref:hypothetical protein n=1 Tax=Clostridium sp. TaxID=1506 RepID=UPI0039913973